MDAMGHVNNTLYFRYMEIVRIDWLHGVGGPPDMNGEGFVIVNAFCNFIRQLEYPGDVLAKHYVANAGRSSFDTYVTLERTDEPGVIYADRRRDDGVAELPAGQVGADARLAAQAGGVGRARFAQRRLPAVLTGRCQPRCPQSPVAPPRTGVRRANSLSSPLERPNEVFHELVRLRFAVVDELQRDRLHRQIKRP